MRVKYLKIFLIAFRLHTWNCFSKSNRIRIRVWKPLFWRCSSLIKKEMPKNTKKFVVRRNSKKIHCFAMSHMKCTKFRRNWCQMWAMHVSTQFRRNRTPETQKCTKFRRNRTHYTHSSVKAFILVAALTNKEGNAQKHQEICSTEKQ